MNGKFSDFFRLATYEEKERVWKEIARKSCEDQQEIINKAKQMSALNEKHVVEWFRTEYIEDNSNGEEPTEPEKEQAEIYAKSRAEAFMKHIKDCEEDELDKNRIGGRYCTCGMWDLCSHCSNVMKEFHKEFFKLR